MIYYANPNASHSLAKEVTEHCTVRDNEDIESIQVEVILSLDYLGEIERIYLLTLLDKSKFRGFMDDIHNELYNMGYKLSDNFKNVI